LKSISFPSLGGGRGRERGGSVKRGGRPSFHRRRKKEPWEKRKGLPMKKKVTFLFLH